MARLCSTSNFHFSIVFFSTILIFSSLILAHPLANAPSHQKALIPVEAQNGVLNLASQCKIGIEKAYSSSESSTWHEFVKREGNVYRLRSEDCESKDVGSPENDGGPGTVNHHSSKQIPDDLSDDLLMEEELERCGHQNGPDEKKSTFEIIVGYLIVGLAKIREAIFRIKEAVFRWIKCHPFETSLVLWPIIVKCALLAFGFGAGVLGGSLAALIQSCIGNVDAGSVFACFQSIGATFTWRLIVTFQVWTFLGWAVMSLGKMAVEYGDMIRDVLQEAWDKRDTIRGFLQEVWDKLLREKWTSL